MKTIEILCSENKGWLHAIGVWAIKKSEGTDFNHVAVLDNGMVYEAVYPESRSMSFVEWNNHFRIKKVYGIKMSEAKYNAFMSEVKFNVPKKYSIWQCFLIWLCNSVGVLENYIEKIIWNGNKAMICSELVAWPMQQVLGYKFAESLDTVGMDEIEAALFWASVRIHE